MQNYQSGYPSSYPSGYPGNHISDPTYNGVAPQVVVYVLSSDVDSQRTKRVESLFNNGLFAIKTLNITPPAGIKATRDLDLNQAIEAYRYQWCLENAQKETPGMYVLIVKDTSVSNSPPERIADIVSAAIVAGGWDVFYLCRWLDRCDLYTDKRPITGMATLLMKTWSPQGTQAIMFSPNGRDIVLGKNKMANGAYFGWGNRPLGIQLNDAIVKGQLSAQCAVPNLIEYDITAAKNANDYRKVNECDVPAGAGGKKARFDTTTVTGPNGTTTVVNPVPGAGALNGNVPVNTTVPVTTGATTAASSGFSLWWILLIILVILFLVWLITRHGSKLSQALPSNRVVSATPAVSAVPVVPVSRI